ncbi:MAG: type II secretion system F family protein [Patescibacteria group bacterium]
MLYKYEVSTPEGERQSGTIDSATMEIAINALQKRNLIIISIKPIEESLPIWKRETNFFQRVKSKDVVILSRQLSTLFEARVPTLESFKLLSKESENPLLRKKLSQVIEDIQGGIPMSQAMAKHSDVFSKFYVNMVRSGEESGKLEEVFNYLADYLERIYELTSKAKNAMFYPAFVIVAFIVVLVLMMVVVVPKLSVVLTETGQSLPIYTRIVLALSDFLRNLLPFILIGLVAVIFLLWRFYKTQRGKITFARFQLTVPYVGSLFKKIFLARISDNLNTLLSSGIPLVRSLEITADVVGNEIYKKILIDSMEAVKGGNPLSESLSKSEFIPHLLSRMMKIGEETGKLNFVLGTIARFYRREVDSAVENLISLIEPMLIIFIGGAVGLLMISILGPIYNMAGSL